MEPTDLKEPVRRSLDEIIRAGRRFVSQKTGIIKAIVEQPIDQDDPLIFSFGALMSDTSRYSPHRCSVRNGGAGLTREEALAATIGESIERYCSNFYDRERFIFSTFRDLKSQAVPPDHFVLFSERQYCQDDFPFEPFNERSTIYWTRGYSLVDRTPKLVPACCVYLPYAYGREESVIGPSISTGLSCGASLEAAILMGIYECVERDAFTIMWLNKLSMPVVDMHTARSAVGRVFLDKFASANMKFCVCDITSDLGIPTFYTLALGNSAVGPLACIGSATRLDAEDAIKKTLVECAQSRPYLRYVLRNERNWTCGDNFSNVRSFDDHARLYSSMPELMPKLQFVDEKPTRALTEVPNCSSGSVTKDIEICLAKLADKGLDVVVVDLTTRDVAGVGFRVVRVIIPGLQPLHGDHRRRFLGGKRLFQVPQILGYTKRDTTEDGLYPWPHPCP